MGKIGFVIPRLVIGAFIQFVCSYITLPLYAIVTQMGSSLKKEIFVEHVQKGLVDWARHAKKTTSSRERLPMALGFTVLLLLMDLATWLAKKLLVWQLSRQMQVKQKLQWKKAMQERHANVSH